MGQSIAKRGKKAAKASQSTKADPSLPKAEQLEKDKSHVGRRVSKNFGGEIYDGTVTKFVPKHRLWKINYDDGDAEEMYWEDLSAALDLHEEENERKGRKGAKNKKSPAAKSNTTPARAKDASPPKDEKPAKASPASPTAVALAVEKTDGPAEAATKEEEVMKDEAEKAPVESSADIVSVMDIGREMENQKEEDKEMDAGKKNPIAEKAEEAQEAKSAPELSTAEVAPAVEKTDVPAEAAAKEEVMKNDAEKAPVKSPADNVFVIDARREGGDEKEEDKKMDAGEKKPIAEKAEKAQEADSKTGGTQMEQKKPAAEKTKALDVPAPPSPAKRRTRGVQKKPTPKKARTVSSIAGLVNSSDPRTFVRRRVAKDFGGETYFGTITEYDDAETPAYWHVGYDDGDEEDYSKKDLIKALKYYEVHGKKDRRP